MGAAGTNLEPSPVNVRIKISALWASMLFVFAYVQQILKGFPLLEGSAGAR